jgi:hypothetical protein
MEETCRMMIPKPGRKSQIGAVRAQKTVNAKRTKTGQRSNRDESLGVCLAEEWLFLFPVLHLLA